MFPQSAPRSPMMPPGMGGGMPPGMGGGMPPGMGGGGMPPGMGGMMQGNPTEAKARELEAMLQGLLQQLYQQFPFLNE